MDKIWYIDVAGKTEGPFSILELRGDERLTPDTLVWKEGFKRWIPIREVAELKAVFEDSEEKIPLIPELESKIEPDEEIVLDLKDNNPNYVYWLILGLIVILYALYQSQSSA